MILLIDNYDSFVYNLARYVGQLGKKREVVRNDAITVAEIQKLNPSHIILSPGPKTPTEAGICLEVVSQLGAHIPILGICLGHQAIGQAYGGRVVAAKMPRHGKSCAIAHDQTGIFDNLSNPFQVGLYHSLAVASDLPDVLRMTAKTPEGEIMALQHREYPVYGVQFHPESVLTEQGYRLLENFLRIQHAARMTKNAQEWSTMSVESSV